MRPKVWQVYEHARFLANDDDEVRGGRDYQNDKLKPGYRQAYREYFRAARKWAIPQATNWAYFNLPANQTIVDPLSVGLTDFNAPELLYGMSAPAMETATFTLGVPVTVTKVGHGLTDGALIVCSGFPASSEVIDLNGAWGVQIVDADTFILLGSRMPNADGVVVTGQYSVSPTTWGDPYTMADGIPNIMGPWLGRNRYAFYRGQLHFSPATEDRQIRVEYTVSGDAPTLLHQEIPIDDSMDFLASRAIALTMQAQGDPRAERLLIQSVGPDFESGAVGGHLEELLHGQARASQSIPRERPPFRRKRNNPFWW